MNRRMHYATHIRMALRGGNNTNATRNKLIVTDAGCNFTMARECNMFRNSNKIFEMKTIARFGVAQLRRHIAHTYTCI